MNLQLFPNLHNQEQLLRRSAESMQGAELKVRASHLKPEGVVNPKVLEVIAKLVAVDAEEILALELERYNRSSVRPGSFRVGLIVADDEFVHREHVELQRASEPLPELSQGLLSILWWSHAEPTAESVRRNISEQIYKGLKNHDRKYVRSLSDMISLEAQAMRSAKSSTAPKKRSPWFGEFSKYLMTEDRNTLLACFYGDVSAKKLGLRPLGFPPGAGRTYAEWLT